MHKDMIWYDKTLLITVLLLVAIGMISVTSSSLYYAENTMNGNANYFVIRHLIYLAISFLGVCIVLTQPIERWQKYGPYLLILGLILLVAVLFIGKTVNGSQRWLAIGPLTFQVSEAMKLIAVVYLAGYLVRRTDEIQTQIRGFLKPLLVLALITGLLLLEPDFGASVVILATSLAMLFLGGAKLWQFIGLSGAVASILGLIAISQPYRLERLMTFLNPWADPFGSGYQLTQSLIAFGRGSIWGQGLGNSLQKLSYLPEAHTDFIFAVLAEEMGLVGVVLVLSLFFIFFYRSMKIGREAISLEQPYAGYLAYGIGFWLTFQALINMGVTSGALPTKGLTLPFISYGGNSLIFCGAAVAILLRIDFENRLLKSGMVAKPRVKVQAEDSYATA
ncbi:putative lipid II flippase FtsW [Aliikangiella maris]|uniref:Lipid II flippase FtsW n=2 Tax=Aliikangiella maris TaxID=3162458 RepID=A0ABV3MJ82_9GAMM